MNSAGGIPVMTAFWLVTQAIKIPPAMNRAIPTQRAVTPARLTGRNGTAVTFDMQSGLKGDQALTGLIALGALALQLASATDCGGTLTGTLLRRLLVMTAQLHLAIDALTLQLLLECAKSLIDIVITNDDLHKKPVSPAPPMRPSYGNK
jgi:hypothetical protein